MKKKIIVSVIVFIVVFIISTVAFLPIGQVASKYINQAIAYNHLNVKYDSLDAGLFGAQMTNIRSGDFVVNKVSLKYNPIGLIFRRFSFTADSPFFMAKGNMRGDTVMADIDASVASLAGLAKVKGGGSVNIKGNYDIATGEGKVDLAGGHVTVKHPMMTVETDSITGSASIKGNVVTISSLKAKGKTSLDAKGSVTLNTRRIDASVLNLQGTGSLMGMNMNFNIQGTAASPRVMTK